MLLKGSHYCQNHILLPVLGDNLYTHWQPHTVVLYLSRRFVSEVFAHNTITFLFLLHTDGCHDACRHAQNVVKECITCCCKEMFTAPVWQSWKRIRRTEYGLKASLVESLKKACPVVVSGLHELPELEG